MPWIHAGRPQLLKAALIALPIVVAVAAALGIAGVRHGALAPVASAVIPVARAITPTPQRAFGKDRIALLVLGIDYDYTPTDLPSSKSARSDTIMAVSLDFPSRTARVLSVPRDMVATFPDGSQGKINAAYGEGGVPEAKHVVGGFLGLPGGFDRYVVLRVDAAKDLIDAVGGLDVTPDETMNYDDNWGHLHIHFKRGARVHMNGEQAVSYSRFRHDACGDPCRIRRQQDIMRRLVAKIKGDGLNDMTHLAALVGVLRRDVDTDVTTAEAISLGTHYAQTDVRALKTEQLPFADNPDVPGLGNVLVPNEHEKRVMVRRIFVDPVPPHPQQAPTVSPPMLAPVGTDEQRPVWMAR
jgi:LCP family protein required for cell wall assembly